MMRGAGRASAAAREKRNAAPASAAAFVVSIGFYAAFLATSARTVGGERVFTLFDDAMISMRYAQNLAAGHGLVWNAGEPAVEGYTNFLWTLILAGVHLLGLSDSANAFAVSVLGIGVLAALLVSTAKLARGIAEDAGVGGGFVPAAGGFVSATGGFVPAAAVLLVGLYYPIAFWTLRGLEVGLLGLLLTEATRTVLTLETQPPARARTRLALLGGAAILTRPDALLPCAILLLEAALRGPRLLRRSVVLPAAALVALTAGAHTAFRWATYGELVPNTAILKMTGRPVLERAGHGLTAFVDVVRAHLAPLLVLVAAGLLSDRALRKSRGVRLVILLFAGQAAYSIAAGGDSWEWMDFSNRFLCVAMPGVLVAAALSIDALARRFDRGFRPALAVLRVAGTASLLFVLDGPSVKLWLREGAFHVSDDARMAEYGRELAACTHEDARLAVVWAGAVPYTSRRACVDLLGKNDPVVARSPVKGRYQPGHDKWNAAHSLGTLRPDVVAQTSLVWNEPGFWEIARRAGYERLANGLLVLSDSPRVDRECLAKLRVPAW